MRANQDPRQHAWARHLQDLHAQPAAVALVLVRAHHNGAAKPVSAYWACNLGIPPGLPDDDCCQWRGRQLIFDTRLRGHT